MSISIVLVGIGGMGAVYVRELLEKRDDSIFTIAGAVDPMPERCPQLAELQALGVALSPDLVDFYRDRRADLAVVASPHQFHCGQTCLALESGSNVLCEKPAAGTIQEVRRMIAAESISKRRFVAVGYQWSFSRAIQNLKSDIIAGRFGAPRRMKCLSLWPRDNAYYRRNDWAGKKRDAAGGWILDGPAQNAMSHDLHNMFYLLGRDMESSAAPAEVEAELYRAYPIENYDTAAMRARTDDGVEILLYATHVPMKEKGPVVRFEFEKGTVYCTSRTSGISAEFRDGTRKDYGLPDAEPMGKLWQAVECAKTGGRPVCGIAAAASQTLCINGMQDSMPEIVDFLPELRRRLDGQSGRGACWERG